MITKPLESLAHTPPFTKLYEYELNGFENPSIGMKIDLTHSISDIADRKSLEQLTPARFGLLSCLQSLPKDLQFDDAERSLDAQDQLVIEIIQVIDLLLISDQGSKNLAHLQQPAPVFIPEQSESDLQDPLAHPPELLHYLTGRSIVERRIENLVLSIAEGDWPGERIGEQVRLVRKVFAVIPYHAVQVRRTHHEDCDCLITQVAGELQGPMCACVNAPFSEHPLC